MAGQPLSESKLAVLCSIIRTDLNDHLILIASSLDCRTFARIDVMIGKMRNGRGERTALPKSSAHQKEAIIIMKLYVGNFAFDMTERTLRELFEPFGTVSEVVLIMDRETGQLRGFGFVTMGNASEGNATIKGLNGKDKDGRRLKVSEARPKDDRGGRPSPGSRR